MKRFVLCLISVLFASEALGHDLWLYLRSYYLKPGSRAEVKVVFGHNFPYEDILIPISKLTEFYYLKPDGKKAAFSKVREVRRKNDPSSRKGCVIAEFFPKEEGIYVLSVSRVRKGTPERVPSYKYAKAVVVVGDSKKGTPSRVLGHRLELVPLKDPSLLKPGSVLPVKVLFDGRPLSTFVYATYAGYWSETEPFPVVVKSDENGIARIKISRSGIWMVVCNHRIDFSASLTFEVRN